MPRDIRVRSILLWVSLLPFASTACSQWPEAEARDTLPVVLAVARATALTTLQVAAKPIPGSEVEVDDNFGYPDLLSLGGSGYLVPGPNTLRVAGRGSAEDRMIGRLGSGPLEFRNIAAVCSARGDSLVVWDQGLRRISIVSSDWQLATSFLLPKGYLARSACLQDGTFVVQQVFTDPRSGKRWLEVELHDLDDRVASPVARTPIGPIDLDFIAEPSVVAAAGKVYIAGGVESEVIVTSGVPGEAFILRTADRIEKLERNDRASRARFLDSINLRSGRARPKARRPGPRLENWPAIARISVGSDRTIWFSDYPRGGGGPNRWVGYTEDGQLIGGVAGPRDRLPGESLSIIRFLSKDTAVVMRTDSLGLRFVQLRLLAPLDPRPMP